MKFTKEEKMAFVKRYQEGETVIRICNENQIPRSTFYRWIQDYQQTRRNLSRGFSAKVTNYSIDVFDNLFLRVSLRQFYIKFYAFSLSKTVEKRSSVDYTKRLSNTSNKFFSANCLTTSCIVSSTKFAYSSFDIVINLFMDLSRSGK